MQGGATSAERALLGVYLGPNTGDCGKRSATGQDSGILLLHQAIISQDKCSCSVRPRTAIELAAISTGQASKSGLRDLGCACSLTRAVVAILTMRL